MSFSFIPSILFCQIAAPLMALDLPKFGRLNIVRVSRIAGENGESLEIRGTCGDEDSFSIDVDLDHDIITGSHGLYNTDHLGSGAIGVILFGIPGLVFTFPLWGSVNVFYACFLKIMGMTFHDWLIYRKLKGKLEGLEDRLWRGFKSKYNGASDQYFALLREMQDDKIHVEHRTMSINDWGAGSFDKFMDRAMIYDYKDENDIYLDIEDWHHRLDIDQSVTLHDWLGMSWDEYARWVEKKVTIAELVDERVQKQAEERRKNV